MSSSLEPVVITDSVCYMLVLVIMAICVCMFRSYVYDSSDFSLSLFLTELTSRLKFVMSSFVCYHLLSICILLTIFKLVQISWCSGRMQLRISWISLRQPALTSFIFAINSFFASVIKYYAFSGMTISWSINSFCSFSSFSTASILSCKPLMTESTELQSLSPQSCKEFLICLACRSTLSWMLLTFWSSPGRS